MNEPKFTVTERILPISESTRKRNPQFFNPVGAMETSSTERCALPALVGGIKKPKRGTGRVCLRVQVISLRHRLLDEHDAVAYSVKSITDAAAEWLGVDDADPRVRWTYAQCPTNGEEGVIVRFEYEYPN